MDQPDAEKVWDAAAGEAEGGIPEETPDTELAEQPVPEEIPDTEPAEQPVPEEIPDTEPAEKPVPEEIPDTEPAEKPVPEGTAEPADAGNTPWTEEWTRHFPDWEEETPDGTLPEEGDSPVPDAPPPLQAGPAARNRRKARTSRKRGVRKRRRGVWIFLALLCVVLLLAAGSLLREHFVRRQDPFLWSYPDPEERVISTDISIPSWPFGLGAAFRLTEDQGESLTPQEVYRTVNPSVVTVVVNLNDISGSVGTGVVFTEDGYLLTNYHVIEGGTDCMVITDKGYRMAAKYVAGDAESDIAVLKLEYPEDNTGGVLPAAQFGNSTRLVVGDPVYAIGNPLGIELRGTMTNGIVSAASRDVRVDGKIMSLIQTNAALNSGNSGGPLINECGQVVGINVVKMISSRSTVEGLGFAIPSASLERLVNDLLSFGEVQPLPLMGIRVEPVPREAEEGVTGLRIASVDPDSPAERAGLQAEDLLLAADGIELLNSQDLYRARNRLHVGDEMTVTLWRDGERMELTLLLDQAAQNTN